jgi:hypothetical protein
LSRLSSCINGENTAISTIRTRTIFGIRRCIIFAAASWKRVGRLGSATCGDYSTAVINGNV